MLLLPGAACGDPEEADDAASSETVALGDTTTASDVTGGETESSSSESSDSGETEDTETTGTSNCGEYPAGPYQWYDNGVVDPNTTLPAMYGPDGELTTLSMAEVHANCEQVKSLVFAFGANN